VDIFRGDTDNETANGNLIYDTFNGDTSNLKDTEELTETVTIDNDETDELQSKHTVTKTITIDPESIISEEETDSVKTVSVTITTTVISTIPSVTSSAQNSSSKKRSKTMSVSSIDSSTISQKEDDEKEKYDILKMMKGFEEGNHKENENDERKMIKDIYSILIEMKNERSKKKKPFVSSVYNTVTRTNTIEKSVTVSLPVIAVSEKDKLDGNIIKEIRNDQKNVIEKLDKIVDIESIKKEVPIEIVPEIKKDNSGFSDKIMSDLIDSSDLFSSSMFHSSESLTSSMIHSSLAHISGDEVNIKITDNSDDDNNEKILILMDD